MSDKTMTGADALLKVFEEEGVEVIFGFPGGAVIPIYDKLYDYMADGRIRHVLPRHEQGAAHMADGYARSTGKVGVCMATSGPGAMNLVTGLANAHMDSVPMVAITGQVKTTAIGKDSFQEADTWGVTIPITKHNYLVKDPADLPDVVREAFYVARSGRPGPVLIDIPSDVSAGECELPERKIEQLPGYNPPVEVDYGAVQMAAEWISEAEKPILYIGGGVIASGASELVRQLAEKANIYVVYSLMGKGGFPDTHPLSLGMPGMHGTAYASYAINKPGLIIAIGARFADRITGDLSKFARGAKVIHIDIDLAEFGKVRHAEIAICGDARQVLEVLVPLVKPRPRGAWEDELDKFRAAYPLSYETPEEGIAPQYVVEQLYELTGGDAIIATEVGQNQMWAAQYYKVDEPRRFLSSGGLGTMGYGFPAAIGAQVGNPDKMVWDIAGDGSIQMCIQELATCIQEKLPIKVAILNNCYLGMVRQWQDIFYEKRYSAVAICGVPDYPTLLDAYGGVGYMVSEPEDVAPTIKQAMEVEDRPCFIDFKVAQEANVFPMIPAGKSLDDLMLTQPT